MRAIQIEANDDPSYLVVPDDRDNNPPTFTSEEFVDGLYMHLKRRSATFHNRKQNPAGTNNASSRLRPDPTSSNEMISSVGAPAAVPRLSHGSV